VKSSRRGFFVFSSLITKRRCIVCENREERFVVPVKPSARIGWWIGWVISSQRNFLRINLLWVEKPENVSEVNICSTPDYVEEFNVIPQAMEFLRSKGVKDFNLTPMEIGY